MVFQRLDVFCVYIDISKTDSPIPIGPVLPVATTVGNQTANDVTPKGSNTWLPTIDATGSTGRATTPGSSGPLGDRSNGVARCLGALGAGVQSYDHTLQVVERQVDSLHITTALQIPVFVRGE